MDASTHAAWTDWKIFWTALGWLGNAVFTSRFLVQWYVTERNKQVTVPILFWWLSLLGSLMMLAYAVCYDRNLPIIAAYAFPWIPYSRNLVIHYRHRKELKKCAACPEICSPKANFCPNCGAKLESV